MRKTLLGIPVGKIDSSKYIMQSRGVIHWKKNGGKGTMECATGFGKSIIACLALAKMLKKNPNLSAMVIVPTISLREQWEEILTAFGLHECTTVYVVNTIALKDISYKVDFLVVDEIHLMAADQFSRIFSLVKYSFIMGLTATIDRLDGREKYLKKYAPVVMRVTQTEAIRRGWINDFIECNVPIAITRDERDWLVDMNKIVAKSLAKFDDPEQMRKCMNREEADLYARMNYPGQHGMGEALCKTALLGQQCIALRQKFLYQLEQKIAATVDLVNEFGLKTITFSQSTAFADEVKKRIGANAVTYHSNMEPIVRMVRKTKKYKTKNGAIKYAEKYGRKVANENGEWVVYWEEPKKIGLTVQKRENKTHFKENLEGIDTICTARALDQGFDVEDVEMGIDASRTSNPTQHTQRTGRCARNFTYSDGTKKQGIFVNLYVANSKDRDWLDLAQKNSTNVVELDSLEECIALIKKRLAV